MNFKQIDCFSHIQRDSTNLYTNKCMRIFTMWLKTRNIFSKKFDNAVVYIRILQFTVYYLNENCFQTIFEHKIYH